MPPNPDWLDKRTVHFPPARWPNGMVIVDGQKGLLYNADLGWCIPLADWWVAERSRYLLPTTEKRARAILDKLDDDIPF